MGSSLKLLLELGLDAVIGRCQQLSDRLINGLAHCESTSIITPVSPSKRAGIVSVVVPDSLATSKHLSEAGIIHSRRENKLRFAPYFYNTTSEIDMAIEYLIRKQP
jgi:cysteine desulfurase/selenocysteine lyase